MKRLPQYNILTANSIVGLTTVVRNAIQNSWEPLGGVAVDINVFTNRNNDDPSIWTISTNRTYMQTMIRRDFKGGP